MGVHDNILRQDEALALDGVLSRFVEDTGVRLAVLISRDGHPLAQCGVTPDVNLPNLCALAIGAFASSEALAQLAGETAFSSIYHQGVRSGVYISLVGETALLLTLFDYNASAPLVRMQARVTAEALIAVLERATLRARTSPTSE